MMNTKTLLIGFLLTFSLISATLHEGHIYSTRTGDVTFFSHTNIEDIEAENHKVQAAFDAETGKIQFSLLIADFEFEKALMQEHFNENYLESHKYPKSTFNGQIVNISAIDVHKDGVYHSPVKGMLSMKDVTKEVSTEGTFTVEGNKITGNAKFIVDPADYNIKIPKNVAGKISDQIEVTVNVAFLKKG